MAVETIGITEGAGDAEFAVELVGGVTYPYVKLMFGAVDTAGTPVSSSDPIPATLISGVTALSAGEAFVGQTGSNVTVITPTITATAGAYSAGDVIGGRLTLTNAMRISSGTGILTDITLTTADGELLECIIVVFDAQTASSIADNAAFAWGAGDHAKFLAKIEVVTADWDLMAGDGVCHKQNLGIVVAANGTANLYAYVVATGTPTFTATTDLSVRFKFVRD